MINKRDIKSLLLQVENINGVFEYVMEMIEKDQIGQAHSLISKMSLRQINWFEQFLDDCMYDMNQVETAKEIINEVKK
jgi:hypothetical protein